MYTTIDIIITYRYNVLSQELCYNRLRVFLPKHQIKPLTVRYTCNQLRKQSMFCSLFPAHTITLITYCITVMIDYSPLAMRCFAMDVIQTESAIYLH